MISLLKIKYSIKIKNKSLIFSLGLYYITCVFLIIFADLWQFVKLTSVLISISLCTNVLSEEYDNKREGLIIPTGTPLYKIVFLRYFISLLISELIIFTLFLWAWITNNLDSDPFLKHFIIIFIYSIFLTLLGLLVSNITKKTINGYAVSIGYFIFQLVGGNFLFGKYIPLLASSFNLTLKKHIIMNNLYFMIIISIILFLINLLYISSEEKLKKNILKIASIIIVICSIIFFVNIYINYNKSILAGKILENGEKAVYIIDAEDKALYSYCKNKNLNFLTDNNFNLEKYKEKNIIIISRCSSKLINSIKEILNLNISLDQRDLMINDDDGVYDVTSYRVLVDNPLNKTNKILIIESKLLNDQDLTILLNEKQGNFVAIKNGLVAANAIYDPKNINLNNLFEKIKTLDNKGWLIKKNNKTEILYRNLEKKDVNSLFSLWCKIKNIIDKNFDATYSNKQFQVYFRNDNIKLEENFIPLKIELLMDLEEIKEYKIRDIFSKKYLDEKGFKVISDKKLKEGFEEFIYQSIIYPELYNDNTNKNIYIKNVEEVTKGENDISREDDYVYYAGKMLCLIKNEDKRIAFINEIISSKSDLSNSEIEKIYSKYVDVEIAKKQMEYFNKKLQESDGR